MKKRIILAVLCMVITTLTACGNENTSESVQTEGTLSLETSETETSTEAETEEMTDSESENEETEVSVETTISEEETDSETEMTTESETEAETEETTTSEAVSETTEEVAEKAVDFSGESAVKLVYNEQCVSLSEITDVKAFFGNPSVPEMSAPSCMGDGEDITYIYDDLTVTVFSPTSGVPQITSIFINGSSVTNPQGLAVGMSENDASAILGGNSFDENGYNISFFAENGVVTEIDYFLN